MTPKTRGLEVRIGINPISWSNDDLPSLGGEIPLETALAEVIYQEKMRKFIEQTAGKYKFEGLS